MEALQVRTAFIFGHNGLGMTALQELVHGKELAKPPSLTHRPEITDCLHINMIALGDSGMKTYWRTDAGVTKSRVQKGETIQELNITLFMNSNF